MKRWCCALLCLWAWGLAPAATPQAGTVAAYFTPWDDAEGALLRALEAARHDVRVQAYILSSRNIARALIEAHKRGVAVEVLADREQAARNENSQLPQLVEAGISVWFETRYAAAHNKIMLIDAEGNDPVVITGSYNFTFSAQARNAENLLIMRGNAPLAHVYLDNWRRHRRDAVAYEEGRP